MTLTLIERELRDGDDVPFLWKTEQYGRAEFRFCLCYKRGKLLHVYMFPMQQPDATEFFKIPQHDGTFSANSWTHQGLDSPYIWRHFWCRDHKAPAFDLYVPNYTTHFEVRHDNIYFARKRVPPHNPVQLRPRRI